MSVRIPTTIGLLALSGVGLGCSDAEKVALAWKQICKANCECPDSGYDEEKNCKLACRGYAKIVEADYAESDEEPCAELDEILDDFKACASEPCDQIYDCLYDYYDGDGPANRLYECWPTDGGYYYSPLLPEAEADFEAALASVPRGIPMPLLRSALYAAACSEQEAERE